MKETGKWRRIFLKALYVQIAFLVLHYLYDFFPNALTRVISGTSEAVFQHMKIAFFSYLLVSLIEYLVERKRVEDQSTYIFARLAATVLFCWPMFILFFTPPAYYGPYELIITEIIWANIILYATSVCVVIFEQQFERAPHSQEFRVVVIVLGLILLSLFVIYSQRDPWFDVFAIPPGWE
jgi:hypothetical protein